MNIKTDKRRVLERNISEEIRNLENGQTAFFEIKKNNDDLGYSYTFKYNIKYGNPYIDDSEKKKDNDDY